MSKASLKEKFLANPSESQLL